MSDDGPGLRDDACCRAKVADFSHTKEESYTRNLSGLMVSVLRKSIGDPFLVILNAKGVK